MYVAHGTHVWIGIRGLEFGQSGLSCLFSHPDTRTQDFRRSIGPRTARLDIGCAPHHREDCQNTGNAGIGETADQTTAANPHHPRLGKKEDCSQTDRSLWWSLPSGDYWRSSPESRSRDLPAIHQVPLYRGIWHD